MALPSSRGFRWDRPPWLRHGATVCGMAAQPPLGSWMDGSEEESGELERWMAEGRAERWLTDREPAEAAGEAGGNSQPSETAMLAELLAAQRLHAQASQATPHYFENFAEPWMPTTADMLDEMLDLALEVEKPHLREQRDEFVEAYFERFSEPLMPTTSAMLDELLAAARRQQTTTQDGRQVSVGTQLEELLREAGSNQETRDALDAALARERQAMASTEQGSDELERAWVADVNWVAEFRRRGGASDGGAGSGTRDEGGEAEREW